MSGITAAASVLITLALIFYSLGVWAEHVSRYLKGWHLVAFWTGFFFDTSGTLAMEMIRPGFDWASSHTITGQIALWLMLGHAIWATRVVRRGSEQARRRFHRLSLAVWGIWLIPYIGGMFLGMAGYLEPIGAGEGADRPSVFVRLHVDQHVHDGRHLPHDPASHSAAQFVGFLQGKLGFGLNVEDYAVLSA